MKIAFVWDWEPSYEQTITWMDGLAAAIRLLGERHDVTVYTDCRWPIDHPYFTIYPIKDMQRPDVILHWADMTRPHAVEHFKLGVPMALCFAGGEPLGENVELFDHVFVESKAYKEVFDGAGIPNSIAFGTNTELFRPVDLQDKVFDVFFPATYAAWKRHGLLASATAGLRVATSGFMYPGTWESDCYEVMQRSGALVLPHLSADALRYMYAASRSVVIPSESAGGSQRTVLEALAMNVPLVVTDSDKYSQYFEGLSEEDYPWVVRPESTAVRAAIDETLQAGPHDTRSHILNHWSHIGYADAIEKVLLGMVA